MIQTTKLLVRVTTPTGTPAAGAIVSARLTDVGVSATGYIDRSHVSVTANSAGIAEINLWPSGTGLSNAEYHVTARGSDGGKLIDGLITIPSSTVEVWLHDIVMTEPPTAKPYDEESILLIQQARIDTAAYSSRALGARDTAQSHSIDAAASIAVAQALRIDVNEKALAANVSAGKAKDAKLSAESARDSAIQSEDESTINAQESELSAGIAQDAAQLILGIFSSAQVVDDAVLSAQSSAAAASDSKDATDAAKLAAQASATTALEAAGITNTRAESARLSAVGANTSALDSAADRAAVLADKNAVVIAAGKVQLDRLAAQQSAVTAGHAATTSLDRSAALIDHAETMRIQINASKVAAEKAHTGAEALFGDLAAIDEAVQLTYANRAIVDVALSNNLIILRPR